ncbi:MAG: ribonuclease domain-containing protein [Clostridia bacterium]
MKRLAIVTGLLLALLLLVSLLGACSPAQALRTASDIVELLEEESPAPDVPGIAVAPAEEDAEEQTLDEDGVYTSKEDLALYIHLYGHLPSNFITKAEAQAAGWTGGSLERCCPGKCIGGDRFGNREGQLPKAKGRSWTECDVNTLGARSRGAERIVFSNDGLIFYTGDHYESFEQLY